MDLKLRAEDACRFDMAALGEVMLRLDPGDTKIKNARSFNAWEGGGEYNAAKGLASCFGKKACAVTALADNEIGRLIEGAMLQGGVDTSLINWREYDGLGITVRNGLNFTERGFGIRPPLGISDRGNTAASQIKPGDFDWDYIFGTLGVRWLHTGGIFAALSDSTAAAALEAVKKAKEYGTVVSYDVNLRASLWRDRGGVEKARRVNGEIARYADVLACNDEDFTAFFEIDKSREISSEACKEMIKKAMDLFGNLKAVAVSLFKPQSPSSGSWQSIGCADGEFYESIGFDGVQIYDRIGAGDAYTTGVIYGLMEYGDLKKAIDCGVCSGALAMTTPGDTAMSSLKEIEALMRGSNGFNR